MKALGVSEADFYAGEGGRRMEIEACGGIQGYKRGSTMQTQVKSRIRIRISFISVRTLKR
jgi:hypothetical protein